MKKQKKLSSLPCPHSESCKPCGLVLLVVEEPTSKRRDRSDSAGNVLTRPSLENICYFQVNPYIDNLADHLMGHKAAIIVDSVSNDPNNGTISIKDLTALLEKATPLKIDSDHGFYLARQLRSLKKSGKLPERIIFLGAERSKLSATSPETTEMASSMTKVSTTLSLLVSKVAETLKRNA